MERDWDVIIIGSGPAGLAAAIYSGRAMRKTLVLERKIFGGQIVNADIIENYPGFAEPQIPAELMEQFALQAKGYGVVLENDEVLKIEREDPFWKITAYDGHYMCKGLVFAAGSEYRFLNVKGEKELFGRGISVCATCDAPFFRDRKVAVIGGGDTAIVEALHLSKFAVQVTLIHRRDALRAEKILQDRAFKENKLNYLWDSEVIQFNGVQRLESLTVKNKKTNVIQSISFDGAFLAIGTIPNTTLIKDFVDLDESGYVLTDISLSTKAPGLFVAGEVIKGNHRQVAISSGMGVQAFLSCEKYLDSLH